MSYRDETATLRAEVERLRAENARVPMRWQVERDGSVWCFSAAVSMFGGCFAAVLWAVEFIRRGWTDRVERWAIVVIIASLLWALAFVRRVPVKEVRS